MLSSLVAIHHTEVKTNTHKIRYHYLLKSVTTEK